MTELVAYTTVAMFKKCGEPETDGEKNRSLPDNIIMSIKHLYNKCFIRYIPAG